MVNSYVAKYLSTGKDGILHIGNYCIGMEDGSADLLAISYPQISAITKFDQKFLHFFTAHGIHITANVGGTIGTVPITLFKRDDIYNEIMTKWASSQKMSAEELNTGLQTEGEELKKL